MNSGPVVPVGTGGQCLPDVLRLCGLEFVAWLVPAQPQCQALWTGVAGVPTVRISANVTDHFGAS